jgi:hypothetical protein
LLTSLGHPKSFDSLIKPQPTPSIDSLRIIEKVYIHTDRNCYYPGDDIWFKAYLIDASDRSLSNHSNNLHVELISPFSKIIINHVIRLDDGLGNGDFKLPDNLKSGRYRIRAYTNYMRNFGDQLFFNKEITIINSSDSINAVSDSVNYKKNKIEINFFPEGGSLVDNVSSVVAFKAVNAIGKGCNVSGEIYSSEGEFIKTFKSSHLGMGSFSLRPVSGLSYYSIVKDTVGNELRSEIPKSYQSGITLSSSTNEDDELMITVCTNSETLPVMLDKDLVLSFSVRKVPLKTISFKLKTYNNSFVLPTEDLPDGIVMMTLSTLEDVPLAERLIYIQRESDFKIRIEPNKEVYKQRDSVAIRISSSTGSDILQEAFLSLSAVEKSFTDNTSQFPSTISSWFLLESDVRGPIEEPSYYFDPSNPNRLNELDLLLLTQGWRDFKWKYDNMNYYPPEVGFTVSGRLRKYNVNKPLEVSMVSIGIIENENSLITTTTVDSSGRFRLEGINLPGEATLIVSAISKKGNPQGLVLLDSLKYTPEKVFDNLPLQMILPEENVATFKQVYEIKETIKRKYRLSDTISLGEVSIIAKKTKDFQTIKVENSRIQYGKPDNEVIITPQFAAYQNAFEVLKGRVAGVIIAGGVTATGAPSYSIRIRGVNSINGGSNLLFLIDGVKKSFNDILSLPVSSIDRIDVLKSAGQTATFGVLGANGVISIITRTGDRLLQDQPVNHSANIKISGYDKPRIFYSPKHLPLSLSAFEPDLRITLFWKPDIMLQPNKYQILKYFNADNSSTIKVTIEGITTTGIPVTGQTEYEVR